MNYNIFANLIATINLIIIVYFYFKNDKIRKNKERIDYTYGWFKNIDVARLVDDLEEVYQFTIDFLNSEKSSTELCTEQIKEVHSTILSIKGRVSVIVNCIDEDYWKDFSRILNDFSEEMTNSIQSKAFGTLKSEFDEEISQKKNSVIEFTYRFGSDIISGKFIKV